MKGIRGKVAWAARPDSRIIDMKYRAPRNVLRPQLLTAFSMACLVFPAFSPAAEDYSSWSKSTDVLLNTSATGANVAGDVANFPVLIRLTSINFPFSQAGGKGKDIRFSKADGTRLDYEIERWDSTRSLADVWVRMDLVKGNAAGQILRMHWGNPAAADSSDAAAVYRTSDHFVAAWHLGGAGTAARPNAVAGGNAAVPFAYDGDENSAGVIAGADSLDGAAAGDYLDVGDGYAEFAAGFTYSVWVYPTAVKKWSHVLDLGNGTGNDNIVVNRVDTSAGLGFHNWNGGTSYIKEVAGQWALNQWQHIAVTMSGRNVRMYRNGAQILADSMPGTMTGTFRTANFLGKSNWLPDDYFQGKLDQPELSKTARGADWIKLAYQNQRAAQTLITVVKTVECPPRMTVSADTLVPEGGLASLQSGVECAVSSFWSVQSGPGPRILDPDARTLTVPIPRVAGDTAIVYRLTAVFADSTRTRDVRVGVREAIPDPVFSMPDHDLDRRGALNLPARHFQSRGDPGEPRLRAALGVDPGRGRRGMDPLAGRGNLDGRRGRRGGGHRTLPGQRLPARMQDGQGPGDRSNLLVTRFPRGHSRAGTRFRPGGPGRPGQGH